MSVDRDLFASKIEEIKQHIHNSRELIGTELANHILGTLGNAYVLDEYFRTSICDMGTDALGDICEDLTDSEVVGTLSRTKAEGWMELRTIYREWRQLVEQAGGHAAFCFTYSAYRKRSRPLQRQH